jgi:hypothetical protein
MAYSALRCATAAIEAAAQKSQPTGLAGSDDSADYREASRDEGVLDPEVDVDVWVREVQSQQK